MQVMPQFASTIIVQIKDFSFNEIIVSSQDENLNKIVNQNKYLKSNQIFRKTFSKLNVNCFFLDGGKA